MYRDKPHFFSSSEELLTACNKCVCNGKSHINMKDEIAHLLTWTQMD